MQRFNQQNYGHIVRDKLTSWWQLFVHRRVFFYAKGEYFFEFSHSRVSKNCRQGSAFSDVIDENFGEIVTEPMKLPDDSASYWVHVIPGFEPVFHFELPDLVSNSARSSSMPNVWKIYVNWKRLSHIGSDICLIVHRWHSKNKAHGMTLIFFAFKHERNALVFCNFNCLFLHVGAESMRSRDNEKYDKQVRPWSNVLISSCTNAVMRLIKFRYLVHLLAMWERFIKKRKCWTYLRWLLRIMMSVKWEVVPRRDMHLHRLLYPQ
jgi:hypothetical protein